MLVATMVTHLCVPDTPDPTRIQVSWEVPMVPELPLNVKTPEVKASCTGLCEGV